MKQISRWRYPFCFIALPTLIAALYYGIIAAPVYVSESKFVVRYTAPPASNAFSSFMQSAGITRSQDDTFSVYDYLQSRDALRDLERKLPVRTFFSRDEADFIARFPRFWDSDSFEALYRYYSARVQVMHNATTGITTLRTTAFHADDAFAMNQALLEFSGELLNRMNDRAREDAIRFSLRETREAEQRIIETHAAITAFRNQELMVDPTRVSTSMLELIGRLSSELAITRARRAETLAAAPDSTAIPLMTSRIAALEQQIEQERGKLVGTDASVAPRIVDYEKLLLTRELANKALASATNALDAARADARRQQLYLEPVVKPHVADEAELPHRFKSVAVVFLVTSIAFVIGWLTVTAARDYVNS